jgi:hypothetical protein
VAEAKDIGAKIDNTGIRRVFQCIMDALPDSVLSGERASQRDD